VSKRVKPYLHESWVLQYAGYAQSLLVVVLPSTFLSWIRQKRNLTRAVCFPLHC